MADTSPLRAWAGAAHPENTFKNTFHAEKLRRVQRSVLIQEIGIIFDAARLPYGKGCRRPHPDTYVRLRTPSGLKVTAAQSLAGSALANHLHIPY
jgi:hypothetical protein